MKIKVGMDVTAESGRIDNLVFIYDTGEYPLPQKEDRLEFHTELGELILEITYYDWLHENGNRFLLANTDGGQPNAEDALTILRTSPFVGEITIEGVAVC